MLTAAGVTVVDGAEADGAVVFLSATGLSHPGWLEEAAASVRLIPVRVGAIRAELVPERLRELNWIDWQPDNVRATFGYVLAGLLSDPGRRDLSRQLSHEAEAWERSGRRNALLINDNRRARRMLDVLHDLDADRLAVPSDTMRQFVQRSVKVSRPRYRRRRWRMIAGVVLAVTALATVAVALPAIRLGAYNNNESIVTSGDHYMLADLPEWSAANAAALLADGTPAEQALAQVTLIQALDLPWEIDALQLKQAPATVPFRHGTEAVAAVGTGTTSVVMVINVVTQRVLWSTIVPGGRYFLSVSPDGGTALGVGPAGAIVISLATHAWRRIAAGTRFEDGELGSGGMAVVRLADVHLAVLNIATGAVTDFGAYPALISVAPRTPGGPATGLVQTRADRIELIRLPSRRVIAAMPGNPSLEVGAIAPDHRHAVIEGGDGQFWTFGAGQPAEPTGIAVPAVPSGLLWSTGHRLLVYSQDQRGQVYYLPRAELLGTICREDTRLLDVIPDYGSDVVTCEGQGGATFWRLPTGPLAGRLGPDRRPGPRPGSRSPRGQASSRSAGRAWRPAGSSRCAATSRPSPSVRTALASWSATASARSALSTWALATRAR